MAANKIEELARNSIGRKGNRLKVYVLHGGSGLYRMTRQLSRKHEGCRPESGLTWLTEESISNLFAVSATSRSPRNLNYPQYFHDSPYVLHGGHHRPDFSARSKHPLRLSMQDDI